MAQKKTYIYHVLIGHNDNIEEDIFMYARNVGQAIDYCKEYYKEKKYNSFQGIKVGLSHTLRDTQILDEREAMKLRNAGADKAEKYSEREIQTARFVTKEEAGEIAV